MPGAQVALLYDHTSGLFLPVAPGSAIPTGTPGLLLAGADGSTARYVKLASDGTMLIDGSAHTQPISATALPLPSGAAMETTLGNIKSKTDNIPSDPAREGGNLASIKTDLDNIYTRQADGNQKGIVRGGAKGTTTAADLTGTAQGTDHQALDVQVMHGGAAKDPTQIRALTSADVVKADQGTKGAAGNAWPQVLYDAGGNAVGVVLDGSIYRLQTQAKIVRASDGAQINPATQETLTAIKDTDGVKKITDALPAGTNEIGKVAQGTKAANSGGWPTKLVDGVNAVELAVQRGLQLPTNVRGLIATGRSDDDFARYLRTDIYGNITTVPADSSQSAFGETRIAQPYQIANLINKYEIDPNDYGTDVAGGGSLTHIPAQSAIRMTVTGASGDKARLRTNNYYRYQAGRGMFVRNTVFHSDTGHANQVRRWGYFDDNDGLFWEVNGTTLQVVRRTSTSGTPVDNPVTQANWNYDKMNGTGPSGVNIDVTKGSIWEIQFQWLGVGIVNWYINGILVHRMSHPNTIAGPYTRTAVLPLSWEIVNSAASSAASFYAICGSIMIEGGEDEPDYTFGVFNPTDKTVGTTEIPLISIRPQLLYNSIENRMTIVPIAATIATDGKRASYRLVLDGVLTGPSWVSASTYSSVEYDETATALTGGMTLVRGLLPNAIDSRDLDLTRFFATVARSLRRLAFGTSVNVLTIMGKNEGSSGGNTLMRGSLTWQESR